MFDSLRSTKNKPSVCQKHKKAVAYICSSPFCNNYRELCEICEEEDLNHETFHEKHEVAEERIKQEIQIVFKGLKVLRKKILETMDARISNQDIPIEIDEKIDQIKVILNNKIQNFRTELRKIYNNNIRQKLNILFSIVEKSYEFLEQQKINLHKNRRLKPFFTNDLTHDLRHYQSYYEEIQKKNVRKFKTGLQHDNVMKLVVSFEQNLSQIFKFNSEKHFEEESRAFIVTKSQQYFCKENDSRLIKREVNLFKKNYQYFNRAILIPSIYYSSNDTYYFFGDYLKESNAIMFGQGQEFSLGNLDVKLETKRINFAVCLFNQEIFIVGGQNQKEGCLIKCEKFVPSQGKTYIINSLNQKSSKHTLYPYKNKFILKFGGTDSIFKEANNALLPQIYFLESQDWKMIELKENIDFGLFPAILYSTLLNKIVVIEGETFERKSVKSRYDIELFENGKKLEEIRIIKRTLKVSSGSQFFSSCCQQKVQERKFQIAFCDEKGSLYFLNFPIICE